MNIAEKLAARWLINRHRALDRSIPTMLDQDLMTAAEAKFVLNLMDKSLISPQQKKWGDDIAGRHPREPCTFGRYNGTYTIPPSLQ